VSVVVFTAALAGASDFVSDVWHRLRPITSTSVPPTLARAKYPEFDGSFVGEIRTTPPLVSASSSACRATQTPTYASQTQRLQDLADFLFDHKYSIVTLHITIATEPAGSGSFDSLDKFTMLSSDRICSGEGGAAVALEDEAAVTAGIPSAIAFNSKAGRIDIVGNYYISRAEARSTHPRPSVMFHRIIN